MELKIAEKFDNFIFNVDTRFQLLLGGYGSGKSHSIALKILLRCLKQDNYRVAVVRNNFSLHKETTYDLLKTLCSPFTPIKSNMTANISFANGSKIIFLAGDNPERLKSLTPVNTIWIEEMSEISQNSFEELKSRQRGVSRPQIICSTNPLTDKHWFVNMFFTMNGIKLEEFYDNEFVRSTKTLGEVYYMHSTVLDNPFVSEEYIEDLKRLKVTNNFKYVTGFLGHLGQLGETVMENWRVEKFDKGMRGKALDGLDFGYVTSMNAYIRVKKVDNKLYVYDEYYNNKQSNQQLARAIVVKGHSGAVYSDSAEPKSISELNQNGVPSVKAYKRRLVESYKQLKSYEIIIHPDCKTLISEFESLTYVEKHGVLIEDEFSIDPHGIDALRYAISYESALNDLKGSNYNHNLYGRR